LVPSAEKTFPTNHVRVSTSVIALALAAEILILLIAPLTYFSLLPPKPKDDNMQEFPLTNDEIKDAWPNLPTTDEIRNGTYGYGYVPVDHKVKNCTVVNGVNYFPILKGENGTSPFNGEPMPTTYNIWLQHNQSIWIQVPSAYLTTSNPPILPSERQTAFLGTCLPT